MPDTYQLQLTWGTQQEPKAEYRKHIEKVVT